MDEVERWNIRWALADDKPERLLDTPHGLKQNVCILISINTVYIFTVHVLF